MKTNSLKDRLKGRMGLGLAALILLLAWFMVNYIRQPDTNSVMRGWEAAQQLGCFSCHGVQGSGGNRNPGSEEEEIPAWDGGMLLMHVESAGEIREWILYGAPKRLWKDGSPPGASTSAEEHASEEGLIHMPAYQGRLSDQQLDDLVDYVEEVGAWDPPPMPSSAQAGRKVAKNLGCFGCHRQGGLIGAPNPGSFKGYIPPWRGEDFRELVQSDEELRNWILEGQIDRIESNPIGSYFSNGQVIQMPAYRDFLSQEDLASIISYIKWVDSADSR